MNKTKLIIFDIDGTLIDSTRSYHEVIIAAMKELGFKTIDTNFNALKHHTDSYALKYNYEQNFTTPFSNMLLDDFEQLIVKHLHNQPKTEAIIGAKETIEHLKNSEFAVAYATGSLPKAALLKMNEAGIWINSKILATSFGCVERDTQK